MLDVSVSYNRYKFLGLEFLTWLWFSIENAPDALADPEAEVTRIDIGNRMVLVNSMHGVRESITIQGDDAGLEEGMTALKKGALVAEMNLVCTVLDQEWRFTLKGESLSISGIKLPETAPPETDQDMEGAVLEKIYLYEKIFKLADRLFGMFIRQRVSPEWKSRVTPDIRAWIQA